MQHLQCKEVVSFTLTFFSEVVILPEIFPEFLLGIVSHPPGRDGPVLFEKLELIEDKILSVYSTA